MDFAERINAAYEEAVQIRRHLHKYPELSEQEKETADYICLVLSEHQIPYHRDIAGNGIVAAIGKESGRCIGIRADIDALAVEEKTELDYSSEVPGVMHACGHDMHTAILLGTGIVLKQIEEKLPGMVKLIFQPSEETIGGARQMIEEGILDEPEVSACIALHMDPSYDSGNIILRSGVMNAAINDFTIEVRGRQCHGAHPDEGIDSIVAAADLIMSLQTIASRFTAPTTPVVVTIGQIAGGTQCNIVPGLVKLSGTLRTLSIPVMEEVMGKIEQIAKGKALSYGCEISVFWDEQSFPPLINDGEMVDFIEKTLTPIFGKEKIRFMPEPSLGGDDFAYFTERMPGVYFNLGCRKSGEKNAFPLHSESFCPEEDSMLTGIRAEVEIALALMKNQ